MDNVGNAINRDEFAGQVPPLTVHGPPAHRPELRQDGALLLLYFLGFLFINDSLLFLHWRGHSK
jgi:hypothetical protein